MNTLRPIRFKIAWGDRRVGDVVREPQAGEAQILVERGIAEYADEQIKRAPVDRMMRARKTERRSA